MSDEHRKDEESEVEGHVRQDASDEAVDDEVEAHIPKFSNVRMDSPSNT